MKTPSTIALAMTWDGARCPSRMLPPKARAFLAGKTQSAAVPSSRKLSELFAKGAVKEVRVCWLPQLRGGDDVLCAPFLAPRGKRLAFRVAKTVRFGDVLGVVYRRG